MTESIDLVLVRGELNVLNTELIGHTPAALTASGLRPSDHAGVVSTVNLKP